MAIIDLRIEDQLRRLGLNGCYYGYDCLIFAALKLEQDPAYLDQGIKALYVDVARLCHMSIKDVSSAISYAIRRCCDCSQAEVDRMCGTQGRPTVAQFLTGLVASLPPADGEDGEAV